MILISPACWQEGRRDQGDLRGGLGLPRAHAGRVYGVVVNADVACVETHRRNLTDWLDWMGLMSTGHWSQLDRYIGYYEPYFNSHEALDKDTAIQEEVRNVARSVVVAIEELRAGRLSQPDKQIKSVRTK